MKNTLIILSFLLLSAKSLAQQLIVPIDEVNEYIDKHGILPKDKYFKDVNGVLNNYLGKWEGSSENKNYSFLITKKIKVQDKLSPLTLKDGLVIQFKITDKNTGKVLYDKFELPEEFKLSDSRYRHISKNKYSILYSGDRQEEINCGDLGKMFLELISPGKLTVYVIQSEMTFYLAEGDLHPCPGGIVLPPFPRNKANALILTKKK